MTEKIYQSFAAEGIRLFCYGLTDSTNKRAREYCDMSEGAPEVPALFIAEEQSAGRGRQGRSFFSPARTGLYMTLLFEAPENKDSFTRVTALCAVAVAEGIKRIFDVDSRIKWVNDIYIGDKKISGILAESFPKDGKRYIAVGIGVNLATEDFPEDIRGLAGSLVNRAFDPEELEPLRFALAFEISKAILGAFDGPESKYMKKYRELSCVIGKRISFTQNGTAQQGRAVDITDMGELCVKLDSGQQVLLSTGEISVRVV